MNRLLLILAAAVGSLLFSRPASTQTLPPAKRAPHIEITQGPALESAKDNWAIIRWTSSNPGGDDEHFGVVHYGTDENNLSQMAKSHVRLNQGHPSTVFRVIVNNLKPGTTYYYTVASTGADGADDGVQTTVQRFTTPSTPQQAGR
jgi:phosphodiesterase/alkaline phosphatase D-like protein